MLLAHIDLPVQNTLVQIYAVPNSQQACFNVHITNRNSPSSPTNPVFVDVCISDTTPPNDNSYYLVFHKTIYPYDSLVLSGIYLGANQFLYIASNSAGVNCVVEGLVSAA